MIVTQSWRDLAKERRTWLMNIVIKFIPSPSSTPHNIVLRSTSNQKDICKRHHHIEPLGSTSQERGKTAAQIIYCIIHIVSVPFHPVQLNNTYSMLLPPWLYYEKKTSQYNHIRAVRSKRCKYMFRGCECDNRAAFCHFVVISSVQHPFLKNHNHRMQPG